MKSNISKILFFVLILSIYLILSSTITFAESVTNIEIVPELDISTFAPYNIKARVSGSPISVTTQIQLLNADGSANWDYYANSTPRQTIVEKTMTYNADENKYISENIYPDSIYPEIFFVPSDVTRNNLALETDIRRNNYHLFHFNNPLTITNDSSFFIEFNAKPRSATSSLDLNVYLVRKNKPIGFFNSSWMNNSDVELVGTFDKNGSFHHTHSEENNSQHNLISLASNGDATLGLKNIDVNGDFWIVLYSDATNVNQGWDLRYQPESFCSDITNRWYGGNKTIILQGNRLREIFTTSLKTGCPDVHTHIARRGLDYYDSIYPTVSATYADNSTIFSTSSIPFAEIPNLAPNPTSFITPMAGNVYSENELMISWNPTTDPNNDNLNYTIYVNDGSATTTLISSTTTTTFNWDTTLVANGTYNMSGKVCDDNPTPLCTDFELSSPFVIEKTLPTYSLDNIEIYSNNELSTSSAAKANDTISLEFDSTGDISETLLVKFFSNGNEVISNISYSSSSNSWIASYTVNQNDLEGTISYTITADNLDTEYSYDTDIIVDNTPPSNIIANPTGGNYDNPIEITLNSFGSNLIKYSFSNDLTGCSSGNKYTDVIVLSDSKTIKAISCDIAGNMSNIVTFEYIIRPRSTSVSPGSTVEKKYQYLNSLSKNNTNNFTFSRNLKIGIKGDDVKKLQIFLNNNGFILVSNGPGSPGNETDRFGSLTKNALKRFQEAFRANILTPAGISSATGYFGPVTRNFLKSGFLPLR
jgi:hypothetical protein